MQKPFLLLLSSLISGIIAGNTLPLPVYGLLIAYIPFLILLFIGIFRKNSLLTFLSVMAILFLQGSMNISQLDHRPTRQTETLHYQNKREIHTLEGVICESPQYLPEKTKLILQTTRILKNGVYIPLSERVLLTVKGRHDLKYGDFIRCETCLRKPHNFNNPGGLDYEKRLRFEKISFTGFIAEKSRIVMLREGQGNFFKGAIERFRNNIRIIIIANAPHPEQTVLQAMIIGCQKEIPPTLMEKFNITGTSHILAISGFNVGIIALWTLVVIRRLFKISEYLMLRFNIIKLSLLWAIPPVVLYALVAGAGMSVLRAAIMALVFIAALLLDRRQDPANSLAAAAVLILMFSPDALFDISFQLSFAAVASILWINPVFSRFMMKPDSLPESTGKTAWIVKIRRSILLFLITTVSVTLGTMPIIVFCFNRLSLVVLPANMILVPILGLLALPLSMMVIVVSPFSEMLAGLLIHCSAWLIKLSLILIDFLAGLDGAAFYVCTPSLWQIAAFYMLLISGIQMIDLFRQDDIPGLQRKRRLFGLLFIVMLTFLAGGSVLQSVQRINNRELTVTAIDVHQGSATLVRFPGGKTLLLDGGGLPGDAFDVGRFVVAPFLWHEGIRKIDIVVLSHPHADHLGGLPFILENFHVQEVWSNGEAADNEMYRRFLEIIHRKGIRHRILKDQKTELSVEKVGIQVFHPVTPDSTGRNFNEKSLVVRMTIGKISLMLPGDISEKEEKLLLKKGLELSSDVLFVPHHGSRMSSSMPFMEEVRPKMAIVSCGPDNSFGVPHREILERYKAIGAPIFRTDMNGAVTVHSDGQNLRVKVFKGIIDGGLFSK